jgi:Pentapeptide repeats (8 copies)
LNTAVIGAIAGAAFGLIGVLIGQYLTQRRHDEALRQTAELEEQRGNEAALLKYFEVVGQLLSEPSQADYLSPILHAQTLTLLEALEPGHKRILLQFLYELSLLDPEKPGLSLQGANLKRANLEGANLAEANLERVHLARANLREANLADANLRKAKLEEAKLVDALLRRANLAGANLKEADLSGAFLQEITKESLTQAQINEAVGNDVTKLPDHLQRPAHWRGGLEGKR